MTERRPLGISRSYWFSLPRGSRLRLLREERERFLFAVEWSIADAEEAMCSGITAGLYAEAA